MHIIISIIFNRNETSLVNLELKKGNSKVNHVLYGQGYTLKAHFSQPDGKCSHWIIFTSKKSIYFILTFYSLISVPVSFLFYKSKNRKIWNASEKMFQF